MRPVDLTDLADGDAVTAPTTASPAGLRGDEGELYRRHHQALLRAVARQVNAPEALVEDACQRAWIILLRRQPDREPALFAWLRTVAVREAWALSRAQRRTVALEELTDIDGDESPVLAGPVDHLEDALEARRALRALATLPDRQRRYLTRLASGHSYQEIAHAEHASYTNVNKHLARARRTLRDLAEAA